MLLLRNIQLGIVASMTCLSMFVFSLEVGEMECEMHEDESVICQFRVDPKKKKIIMESCPNNGELCVNAIVSTRQETVTQTDGDDDVSSLVNPPTTVQEKAASQEEPKQPRILEVGKATYRPPYSQYGYFVAATLERAPAPNAYVVEWANWYLELGNAHFPIAYDDYGEPAIVDWYELELAVNALQRSITVFDESTTTKAPAQEEFVASVYFNMGEAYFMDPDLGHLEEALESFQKARTIYEGLREHPEKLSDSDDIEQRYAEVCTKVAMAIIASIDPRHEQQEWVDDLMNAYPGTQNTATNNDVSKSLSEAQDLFETAIAIYQRYIQNPKGLWDRLQVQVGLALALQNAASTAFGVGNMPRCKDYYQQAIALQLDSVLPNVPVGSPEHLNSKIAIADLYMSLADMAIQMGDYSTAKEAYQNAMEWHTKHDIDVAPMQAISLMDDDDALQQYLDTLQEYRQMSSQGGGGQQKPKSYEDQMQHLYDEAGGYEQYYEKDDGYEGDLLASLGAIYLSRGEAARAVSYLEQSVVLYQKQGEEESRAMADAKLNLAMGYFRVRRFADSQRTQFEALDMYLQLYGEGINPYLQGLEEYEDMLNEAMGGQPKEEKKGGVENPMIDLEKFKQSIKNATEAAQKNVKEEL